MRPERDMMVLADQTGWEEPQMDDRPDPQRSTGRSMRLHGTDGISLTFGMIFLGAALLWLVAQVVTLDAAAVGWIVVSGLFVLGALGLAHAITRASRRRDADDQPP